MTGLYIAPRSLSDKLRVAVGDSVDLGKPGNRRY